MKQSYRFMLSQYLATLNNQLCLTAETHAMREQALEILPGLLDSLLLDDTSLDQLLSAYFICSYAITPQKHEVKKSINKLLRTNLLSHRVKEFNSTKARIIRSSKPVCVIITNWFTSSHVMYRCFGKSIAALRKHFYCVNLCLHKTDYEAAQCFDKVIQCNYGPVPYYDVVKQLLALIEQESPDVVLFADIAMHPYGVMLSNLRMAPLQAVILGHPAPAHSSQIDAFIMEDSYKGYTPDFSERIEFYPREQLSIRSPLTGPLAAYPRNPLPRIIVPCSIHKITYPFLCMLAKLTKQTGAEINITTNVPKDFQMIETQIHALIPDAVVHPGLHYDQYLQLLSQMDMFIMTYPFSGYSTVLDCLSQGIPGIVHNGNDVLSHQAAALADRIGTGRITAMDNESFLPAASWLAQIKNRTKMADELHLLFSSQRWQTLSLFSGQSEGIAETVKRLHEERA